jgi:hypothetical protein
MADMATATAFTRSVAQGEAGTPGGPGDAFYFLFAVVPILAAFLLLDLAALGWILFRTPRPNRLTALALWCAIVAQWCGAVALDRHRAFRNVEARYSSVRKCGVSRGAKTARGEGMLLADGRRFE